MKSEEWPIDHSFAFVRWDKRQGSNDSKTNGGQREIQLQGTG
jgi:hypothetical protein